MKRKRILLFSLLMFFSFNIDVSATSGCCSSHGGVNCNKIQANGNVVCNDGWTGSSCTYSSMVKCQGYSPTTLGSTQKSETYVYGCIDKAAKNYNSKANKDNGSCIYYIYGCMNKDSINYNSSAEKDDGSCIEAIYGCMDESASNYNGKANVSDDSCKYITENETPVISTNTENNKDINGVNSSQPDDGIDLVSGIMSFGIIGTIGYFAVKKFKK